MSGFFDSFLRKVTGGLEMPDRTKEKLLEVNLGCFGGFDSQAMQKCWRKAYDQFLEYLKTGSPKHAKVTEFWEHLKTVEVKGTENLFSNSLDNLVNIIANQMGDFEKFKKFLLVSIGEEFKNNGEENYFLLQAVIKELEIRGNTNAIGVTVRNFLKVVKEAEDKGSALESLKQVFTFDDFTDEELEKELKGSGFSLEWTKSIFKKLGSLYPRELEKMAGRYFASHLEGVENLSTLVVKPINGKKSVKFIENSGATEVYEEDEKTKEIRPLKLDEKVLKIEGSTSGNGIYMYHKKADTINKQLIKEFGEVEAQKKIKYFNEKTIQELTKDHDYTLEDFVHAPKIFIPYDLRNKSYGKMTEYTVDVRFGYYFDPSRPNEIKVMSSYGRFNYPGEKSNIAQGGGVVDIKVVNDAEYKETKVKMLEMVFDLEREDGKFFQDRLSENLQNDNLTYNGQAMAMSPLPFIISESAFKKMKGAALQIANNLKSDKPFMFALDAFLNPAPTEHTKPI